ncbi:MAG TPA: 3',5'-cyclic-nucleotide phosphodiesterase [Sulfuricaulis sp.]|nr:3',5'-cyclic-nucleotide phosphodiesterase [Sulfuricaulis sp.]
MKIRILGYNGSIGSGRHTTSFLIGDDILIDAGTGVCKMSIEEMLRVRHIFLTHSHLDHITGIPLMIDSVFGQTGTPVTVHARAETLAALREHIFNWTIWPDFSVLPDAEHPVLCFETLAPGESRTLGKRTLHSIPVNHVVPAVGYRIENDTGAFAFSGDTTTNDSFWDGLNRFGRLDLLIVEAAFADKDIEIARKSGHYCPRLLAADLPKLRHHPRVCLTHPKPGAEENILRECRAQIAGFTVEGLEGNEVFQI